MQNRAIVGAALVLTLVACGDDDGGALETVTQLIGPAGGTVQLASGGKVEIPAGALSADIKITITKLNDSDVPELPPHLEPAGKPYAFKPHGLMFAMRAKIELPYTGADLDVRPMKLPNEEPTLDSSDWTTVFPSDKDADDNKLSMDVDSFSVYMAARPRRNSGVITLPDGAIDDGSMPDATIAGSGGTGGSGGTSGSGGTGGIPGMDAGLDASTMDAGMDANTNMDATVDATMVVDAGTDASTPFSGSYIKASNTGASDMFGNRIAIDGDTLVVGAAGEDSNATGINGDQANNGASYAGAAYVFVRSGGVWTQQAYLKASNAGANDMFGDAVAISGDTIVIGAYSEDSNATGVNGNEADNSANFSGAAYVFVRNGTTWTQQAYLKASNSHASLNFGVSVAVGADTIVVGATGDSSNATGVNGDESNTSASGSGAAYVFRRTGTTWAQEAYLKASNTETGDGFGISVAITDDGQDLVVGADREDSNAIGINGDESDNSMLSAGAVYLFSNIGAWQQRAYIKPSHIDAADVFGYRVAIDGITIVVAAPGEDSNATGDNGDPSDNSVDGSGAVFVFGNDEGSWRQISYLKASNTNVGDEFGTSVAIEDDILVVGAQSERSNATGINGDQLDNSAGYSGAAYLFAGAPGGSYYPYTSWRQQAYLKASNTEDSDNFGIAVGISNSAIVVGAQGEDSNAVGIGGDESNNDADGSGAVYAFDSIAPVFTERCNDGYDDDGDDSTDCNDSECIGTFECVTGCLPPNTYTPLDPGNQGIAEDGLVLWLRGDVGVGYDEGGYVCSWEDQSGADHHFGQETGTRGIAAEVDGQAAIDFLGGEGLSRPGVLGIASTSGRTIFAIAQATNVTARSGLFLQGLATDNSEWIELELNTFNTVGQRFCSYMTGNAYDSNVSADLLPHVHTLLIDSMTIGLPVLSVMHQRVDGALTTLTRTPGGTGNGLVESFNMADTSHVGLNAQARIAEMIVYDRALSPAEIDAVEAYLAARYSVTLP